MYKSVFREGQSDKKIVIDKTVIFYSFRFLNSAKSANQKMWAGKQEVDYFPPDFFFSVCITCPGPYVGLVVWKLLLKLS